MEKEGRRDSSHLSKRCLGRAQLSCSYSRPVYTWRCALTSWNHACWKACTSPGEQSAWGESTSAAGSSAPRTGSWSAATPSWGWAGGSSGSCATSACACGEDGGQSKDRSLKRLCKTRAGITANVLLSSLPLAAAVFWDFVGISWQRLRLTRCNAGPARASDGNGHSELTTAQCWLRGLALSDILRGLQHPFWEKALAVLRRWESKNSMKKKWPKFLIRIKWELHASKSPIKFKWAAVGD